MIFKKKFSPEEIERKILKSAFEYYNQSGFPYVKLKDFEIWEEFLRLKRQKGNLKKGVPNSGAVLKSSIGQKICYHFMPHEFNIKCGTNFLTAVESFGIEKNLKRIIKLVYKYEKLVDPSIRTYSKLVGAQFAANFAPSVAKDIYNNYLGNNEIYYDYSCGFGGRLLGFIACDFIERGAKYIGVEPSTKTFIGLSNMIQFFDVKNHVSIYKDVAENFCPNELIGKVKLAFSSPPYFNREIYSNERTQSCNKFKTWDKWLNGFWFQTIDNCHKLLKKDGYFIANINDIKVNKNLTLPLIGETVRYCEKKFSKRHPNLYLFMSGFGTNNNKNKKEIFLIFQKKQRKIKRRSQL